MNQKPRLRVFKQALSICMLLFLSIYCQAQDRPEKLLKRGNNIYIAAKDKNVVVHAKRMLDYRNYWNIVDDIDDADFIMQIKTKTFWMGSWKAYAVFIDPDTEKPFHVTKRVHTFWSFSFHDKKKVVKKLIRKRIRKYYNRVNEDLVTDELQ